MSSSNQFQTLEAMYCFFVFCQVAGLRHPLLPPASLSSFLLQSYVSYAGDVTLATLKMQDKKMQDWNLEDNFAGLENAGLENAGVEKKSYTNYK